MKRKFITIILLTLLFNITFYFKVNIIKAVTNDVYCDDNISQENTKKIIDDMKNQNDKFDEYLQEMSEKADVNQINHDSDNDKIEYHFEGTFYIFSLVFIMFLLIKFNKKIKNKLMLKLYNLLTIFIFASGIILGYIIYGYLFSYALTIFAFFIIPFFLIFSIWRSNQ